MRLSSAIVLRFFLCGLPCLFALLVFCPNTVLTINYVHTNGCYYVCVCAVLCIYSLSCLACTLRQRREQSNQFCFQRLFILAAFLHISVLSVDRFLRQFPQRASSCSTHTYTPCVCVCMRESRLPIAVRQRSTSASMQPNDRNSSAAASSSCATFHMRIK